MPMLQSSEPSQNELHRYNQRILREENSTGVYSIECQMPLWDRERRWEMEENEMVRGLGMSWRMWATSGSWKGPEFKSSPEHSEGSIPSKFPPPAKK